MTDVLDALWMDGHKSEPQYEFPVYALPANRLLELTLMRSHEDLQSELVVWNSQLGLLVFTSHMWTSLNHPDPAGLQLRVLQDFMRDLQSNVRFYQESAAKTMNVQVSPFDLSDLTKVFVWLDYWSIPQKRCHDQRRAISSIACYVQSSAIFVMLVPHCVHQETNQSCDYSGYCKRGWCLLERLTFFLKDYRKGVRTEIFIVSGDKEADARVTPSIVWSPEQSVFNGAFTCCSSQHRRGGNVIACDRQALISVVSEVFNAACERARNGDDMALFRKMLAQEWTLYDGLEPRVNPSRKFESVQDFLEAFELKDTKSRTESGHAALHYAAWANDGSLVKLLVKAQADLEAKDNDADTPLIVSIMSQSMLSVGSLLECRASVDGRPYFVAAALDRREALEMILQAGADPNARTPSDHRMPFLRDSTGIHIAARQGYSETVRMLLEFRADPTQTTGTSNSDPGSNSIDFARMKGHSAVLQVLEESDDNR